MRVSTLAQNTLVKQQVAQLQGRMLNVQSQISTGQKANAFHELRSDSSRVLTLRNHLQTIDKYQQTISLTETRITVMQSSFTRMREVGEQASLNAIKGVYENLPRLPTIRMMAETQLSEVVGLANQTVDGRALFAGREIGTSPVETADKILNGDPATGRQGLLGLIADRATADMVDDTTTPGRLAIAAGAGPATVTLTDADGTDNFGFRMIGITSANLTVNDVSGAAPQHALQIDNFAAIVDGENTTIELGLPDGSTTTVTVTAVDDISAADPALNAYQIDPASEDNTAAAMAAAVLDVLREAAENDLRAASAITAGNMFFDSVPPQYVGDPSGTPTIETDDPANPRMVQWYLGDTDDDPRAGQRAKVADGTVVEYGVRADEHSIMETVKGLALYASIGFAQTTDEVEMYRIFADKVANNLSKAGSAMKSLIGEIGLKEESLVSIKAHHESFKTLTNNQLVDIEGVDLYEASSKLSAYEVQLQASYQVTARLQQLTIVNFMPR